MKASILEAHVCVKAYLGFTLEINGQKLQYVCLQRYVALQKALFLTAFSTLAVVSVQFFAAAN